MKTISLRGLLLARPLFFALVLLITCQLTAFPQEPIAAFRNWHVKNIVPTGRIDAIRWLGGSTVVLGTRGQDPGKLFLSEDFGLTWRFLAKISNTNITCITESGNPDVFFVLTGQSEVFGTQDRGKSWKLLAKLKKMEELVGAQATYGITMTPSGTLLVTDTDKNGGHIYRSTDYGTTWQDLGRIGKTRLYRMEQIRNNIIVNGWDGCIYMSTDDGQTWKYIQKLSNAPLYATEYAGQDIVLQVDEKGWIFRSVDRGYTWTLTDSLSGAADDFISTTMGAIIYGTYTNNKNVYLSIDWGKSWSDIGTVPTVPGDWLDHGISIETTDSIVVVAGTNKGFVIRNAFAKKWLYQIVNKDSPKLNHTKGQSIDRTATTGHGRSLLTGVVPNSLMDAFNFIIVNGPEVTVQGKEATLLRLFDAAVEWLTDEVTLVGGKSRIALKNRSNIPLEIDFVCKELGLPRLSIRLMPDSIADIPISVDPETVPYFEAATIRLVVPNFKTEQQTSILLHKRILFRRDSVQ